MNNNAKRYALLLAAALCCVPAAGARNRIPRHPSKLTYDSLSWEVPCGEAYRRVLDDSLVLYVASDRSLPRIVLAGHIRYGSLYEPAGSEGLTSMLCALLRSGGVRDIAADTLDMLLDLFAIQAGFTPGDSRIEFKASFLSEYTDTALALLARMLFTPAFEADRIETERAAQLQRVRHRFDNPAPLLSAAHSKAMYASSAAGRMSTTESLNSITRQDLSALHQAVLRRPDLILAASGDFDADSMTAALDRLCPRAIGDTEALSIAPVVLTPPYRLLMVPREITKSYVRMSLPMFQRPHPDYYACSILNHILGGGSFSSRLNTVVRSDAGLTYSIYSTVVSHYHYPGTFFVQFFTRTSRTLEAMRLVLREIGHIREQGVSAEELESAKTVLIDGLPSMFRGMHDIVEHYSWNEYYGRDMDHYRRYPERLRTVSAEDVLRVAQRYLNPDSLTYIVVGDTAGIAQSDTAASFSLRSLTPALLVSPDSLPYLP